MQPSDCLSAVSSALSQKCSGSSYPYIRNGFFKLSVIQEVSNITQIALRKLRNKNTIFLSYHQTFSSRFFEFYLLHTDSHGFSFHTEYRGWSRIFFFCHELENYRIIFYHTENRGVSRNNLSCPEIFLFNHTEYHGESRKTKIR